MPNQKLQPLKGFRDFLPQQAIEREFLVKKITEVFEKYGFDPLQTPAVEYTDLLLGKYGEDADKLVYNFEDRGGRKIGLRYDQTVPTARVVGRYSEELPKPFKRYQIQNVWRSENTQKGRYREFLHCDADIIGNVYPPLADAEILSAFYDIYKTIGIKNLKIVFNSRNVLKQLIKKSLNRLPKEEEFLSIVRSIDKLDKIGEVRVRQELELKKILNLDTDNLFKRIKEYSNYTLKDLGVVDGELYYSLQMATENFNLPPNSVIFSPTLARGLNYYTGLIFEIVSNEYPGSLGGGGRYDNLIEQLGGPKIPAVGFAIGFDRTLEVAKEQGLIPERKSMTKVLVAYLDNDKDVFPTSLQLTGKLRAKGVNTEIYLDPKERDISKQLKYADKKGIPYVVIIGSKELESKKYILKNMMINEQTVLSLKDLLSFNF